MGLLDSRSRRIGMLFVAQVSARLLGAVEMVIVLRNRPNLAYGARFMRRVLEH